MIIFKKVVHHESTKLDIMGATLLSTEEAEALPLRLREYKNWWWLRSRGYHPNLAALVNYDGDIFYYGDNVDYDHHAIRPALQIKNLESSNLEIGDTFLFGDKEFEIVSENFAFCITDIDQHRFDGSSNVYNISEIKTYINEWFEKNKEYHLLFYRNEDE